jgi:CDP-glucose 4,6-dehydratase
MIDRKFWQGKKVFITGHSGFKGSWLCLLLDMFGADITGYSLQPPTEPNLFDLCRISSITDSILDDIRDVSKLKKAIAKADPQIVIHMAAQPIVRDSYSDPRYTYETNIMGTVNLFEAIRAAGSVRSIVNVTTDKCYENPERNKPFSENEPLGGHDPYSSSKACSEIVSGAYKRSFNLPLATARSGNVIGGGDWGKDRIIPDLIRAYTSGCKMMIRNPTATRPWQHVLEPLSGYLILAEKLYKNSEDFSQAWNFGPEKEDEKSVEWIVKAVISGLEEQLSYSIDKGAHLHEAHYLRLDSTKAMEKLGWKPKWDITTAARKTAWWYENYRQGKDPTDLCLSQIREYFGG